MVFTHQYLVNVDKNFTNTLFEKYMYSTFSLTKSHIVNYKKIKSPTISLNSLMPSEVKYPDSTITLESQLR